MKPRDFKQVAKDIPVKDRIDIIKATNTPKAAIPKTAEEKLSESIDSLAAILKQAMDKPGMDAKIHLETLKVIMDGLRDIKAAIPQEPEKKDDWSKMNVSITGRDSHGNLKALEIHRVK